MRHAAFALPALLAVLQGCAEPSTGRAQENTAHEHAVLDRLLALPLEDLVTALEDTSVWKSG